MPAGEGSRVAVDDVVSGEEVVARVILDNDMKRRVTFPSQGLLVRESYRLLGLSSCLPSLPCDAFLW